MAPPLREKKILLIRSGNKCAFPGCQAPLVKSAANGKTAVITGEIAHIVSSTPDGPRGSHYLPFGEHDRHTNLIGLCAEHHTIVDSQLHVYTVEVLRQMKQQHEESVAKAVSQSKGIEKPEADALPNVHETLHSTLLPVLEMPRYVYAAPCPYKDSQEKEVSQKVLIPEGNELCPFIIREEKLFAFTNLRYKGGPFRKLIDADGATGEDSEKWWGDADRCRWFVTLLNRTLNKLTGRKGLRLDKEHRRYYFQAEKPGEEVVVKYRPLNRDSLIERKVVWQPRSRKTGELRPYWNHLAVNLRLLRVSESKWSLCIRPEMRITRDGVTPIESESVGSHVTRKKSRIYNFDLLEEVNFWRDFLGGGTPNIILWFGGQQRVVISTTLMATEIDWPGIPEEHAKEFKNVEYDYDLFSMAELQGSEEAGEVAAELEEDVEDEDTEE